MASCHPIEDISLFLTRFCFVIASHTFVPSARLLEVNFWLVHPVGKISIFPSSESKNEDDNGG
jgi:hypothetical protein